MRLGYVYIHRIAAGVLALALLEPRLLAQPFWWLALAAWTAAAFAAPRAT